MYAKVIKIMDFSKEIQLYHIINKQMTPKEIATFYGALTNGEKGRFTAYLSLKLGGSPHTWQQKMLSWAKNAVGRSISPVIEDALSSIISKEEWRQ